MVSAMYLAVDIYRNRAKFNEMNKNTLGYNLIRDVKNNDSRRASKSSKDGV